MSENPNPEVVVLPQVLEDVLALKNQRTLELGTEDRGTEESITTLDKDISTWEKDETIVCI